MGDGVNIAARLQSVAKPGTICLSEDAYRQVKSRLDLKVSDLGATPLKNIAEPVRVYSLDAWNPGSVCIIVTISRRPLAFRSMNRNIAFGIFLLTLFHGRVRT
jgi:adenylate cyclase